MKLLVSGCTKTMGRLLGERPDRLGILLTPADGNKFWWPYDVVWACDNGCFNGLNSPEWLRMLAKIISAKRLPSWIACPDSVANAVETQRLFNHWHPMMRELGLPVAYVLQDGIERWKWQAHLQASWDNIDAVFVGGSTAFKLSDEAMSLTKQARDKGKLVHFGRVNSLRRILHIARAIRDGYGWCDTIDGGSASRWGDVNIPKLIRYMDKALADKQLTLWSFAS